MIYSPSPKPASPVPPPPGSFLTYTAHVQGHHLTPSPPNWAIHPESCEQPTPRLLSSAALGTPHAGSRNGCRWTFLAPGVSSDTFICACRPGDRSLLPYHTSGLAKPVHPVSSEEAEGKGGGEGAGRRGQSEPQEDMGQDGAQHTGLAEFGNKSVSTEREGVAKMTSQLRKGLDWGRLWVKGAPRRQGGSPGRGPAGSRR